MPPAATARMLACVQHRKLGRTELEVPVVVFGAWAIGGWNWGGSDEALSVRAIQAGIDAGIDAIDTAPIYGCGRSEELVGRALQGRRERALILTKVGLRWDDPRGTKFFETVDQDGILRKVWRNSRPDSIVQEVERSLARLGCGHLDLVQIHWHDPGTPLADSLGALLELRRRGLVREIGVSNFDVELLEEAQRVLGDVPLASDQPKYSLVAREAEREVLPWCARHGVGTLVYSPLEQGLLTGKVDAARNFPKTDGRHKRGTFTPENRERVNALLQRVVRPIALEHDATLAQVVLAWTLAQPGVTSAIAGARGEGQARENAGAGELVLSVEELATIRRAFEDLKLAGLAGVSPGLKGFVKRLLGR